MGFIQGLRYPEELENIVFSLYKNNFQEQRYRGFTTVSTSEVIASNSDHVDWSAVPEESCG